MTSLQSWKCPNCGAPNRGDYFACGRCGKLRPEHAGSVTSSDPGPAPEVICGECGNRNAATNERCRNCSLRLNATTSTPAPRTPATASAHPSVARAQQPQPEQDDGMRPLGWFLFTMGIIGLVVGAFL